MTVNRQLYRKLTILLALPALLGLIGYAFYYQDWQYSVPTKKPKSYKAVPVGTKVKASNTAKVPILYHFSGAGCPCSEFVLDHLQDLTQRHKGKVQFVYVEEGPEDEVEGLPARLKGLAAYQFDKNKTIAKKLGVYATPVAAIVDANGKVYFTGNYNRSRYCRDPHTEYVRMALDSLSAGKEEAHIDAPPVKGCAIFEGIETLALETTP